MRTSQAPAASRSRSAGKFSFRETSDVNQTMLLPCATLSSIILPINASSPPSHHNSVC